jgi:hypothetical protein
LKATDKHVERALQGTANRRPYVFSVFAEFLPLPAGDERGSRTGESEPQLALHLLSPALLPQGLVVTNK